MITFRRALAHSRNIPALKVTERVGGIKTVIEYARKFGITSPLPAYLPVALGAADITLWEQTAAFTTFPNDGVRVAPRMIRKVEDYDGRVLEENYPEVKDVVSARTARIMVGMLREVVLHGTGAAAAKLNHPLGGKTGTTNDFTDAWFVGFSPSMTCGVWVGFDEKKTLGNKETGADGRAADLDGLHASGAAGTRVGRLRRAATASAQCGRAKSGHRRPDARRRGDALMRRFFRWLVRVLVLIVVFMASALTAMRFAIHGRQTHVPKIVGMTPHDAESALESNGLVLDRTDRFYSADIPAGRIVSQVPSPGEQVRRGWRVRVAESMGPQRVTIPDLTGDSERSAEINIRAARPGDGDDGGGRDSRCAAGPDRGAKSAGECDQRVGAEGQRAGGRDRRPQVVRHARSAGADGRRGGECDCGSRTEGGQHRQSAGR